MGFYASRGRGGASPAKEGLVSERDPLPAGRDGDREAMGYLLDQALQGDRQALDTLISLIQTRHYAKIIGGLRKFRRGARTQTLEDIFQDSIIELVEKVRSGGLADLAPQERSDILRYFEIRCERKLRDHTRPRGNPLFDRDKADVPAMMIDENAPIPGDERKTEEHRRLLESAILRLDPLTRKVLERHLNGVPYGELAKETGKSENALAKLVWDAKMEILMDIVPRSPTARLNYEKERASAMKPDTAPEVRRAVDLLPRETRKAICHVHYEGGSIESLAGLIGDHGLEKARSRLKKGYEVLSSRLRGAPFPETFQELDRS